MNREQRRLSNNTRDATRLVSRKPSDTEGNNGDFAVGDTAQGPMVYVKFSNKWHSFSPRNTDSKGKLSSSMVLNNMRIATVSLNGYAKNYQTIKLSTGGFVTLTAGGGAAYETLEGGGTNFNITSGITGSTGVYASYTKRLAADADGGGTNVYGFAAPSFAILAPFDMTVGVSLSSVGNNTASIGYQLYRLPDGETDWDTYNPHITGRIQEPVADSADYSGTASSAYLSSLLFYKGDLMLLNLYGFAPGADELVDPPVDLAIQWRVECKIYPGGHNAQ